MANVGTAAAGKTLIGAGNGVSPTFASIGTNSGISNNAFVLAQGNSAFIAAGPLTSGQIFIGSSGVAPIAATLTPGTGISISSTAGSIVISATAAGFNWTDVTSATQAIVKENGYLTDRGGGVTYTLPSSAAIGDTFIIVGKLGLATITPNANQQLLMGSSSGTVGVSGTAVATNVGDSVTFVCTTSGASTVWRASSFVGNWTLS